MDQMLMNIICYIFWQLFFSEYFLCWYKLDSIFIFNVLLHKVSATKMWTQILAIQIESERRAFHSEKVCECEWVLLSGMCVFMGIGVCVCAYYEGGNCSVTEVVLLHVYIHCQDCQPYWGCKRVLLDQYRMFLLGEIYYMHVQITIYSKIIKVNMVSVEEVYILLESLDVYTTLITQLFICSMTRIHLINSIQNNIFPELSLSGPLSKVARIVLAMLYVQGIQFW